MAAVNYGSIKRDKYEKYQGRECWTLGPKEYILLILLQLGIDNKSYLKGGTLIEKNSP